MSAVAPEPSGRFISGLEARRRPGVGYSGLTRLALLGRIRVRIEPGMTPRDSLSDVERIAVERRVGGHRTKRDTDRP